MKTRFVKCAVRAAAFGFVGLCSLAAAAATTTYTWKDSASGLWTTKANWDKNAYPNGTSHIATFPATMNAGVAITNNASIKLSSFAFSNAKPAKFVSDNGQIEIKWGSFAIGSTGPSEVEFRGAVPQVKTLEGHDGRIYIGKSYATRLSFVLPQEEWSNANAPITTAGDDSHILIYTNFVAIAIDASQVQVPADAEKRYVLVYAAGNAGLRSADGGFRLPKIVTPAELLLPEDATGIITNENDKALVFILKGPTAAPHDEHVYGDWCETVAPKLGVAGKKRHACTVKYCTAYEEADVPAIEDVFTPPFAAANTIICLGDSLTHGDGLDYSVIPETPNYYDGRLNGVTDLKNYPYWLATKIPTKYNVLAQSKGGKTTDAIVSWMGGIPLKTSYKFTLPAEADATVSVPTNVLYNGTDGGYQHEKKKTKDPDYANEYYGMMTPYLPLMEAVDGKGDTIAGWLGGVHVRFGGNHATERTVCRTDAGDAAEIPVGSTFVPDAAITYRNAIKVIFAGANDGNDRAAAYIKTIQDAISATGTERYLFISAHNTSAAVESQMQTAFGSNYLNLRALMAERGVTVANKLGYTEVKTWNAIGETGLLVDSIHFNEKGCAVLAEFVSERLEFLKYIEGGGIVDPTIYGNPDTQAITYTWKDGVSGPWHYTTNWTPSAEACYGIPSADVATALFPNTLADIVVTNSTAVTVKKIDFQNAQDMTMVVDNGRITIAAASVKYGGLTEFGKTGPLTLVLQGAKPQVKALSGYSYGRITFGTEGGASHLATVVFKLPQSPWTQEDAPLACPGDDVPLRFYPNTRFVVDAAAVAAPYPGTAVTNVLAYASDGMRVVDNITMTSAQILNLPADTTGELVEIGKTLCFVLKGPENPVLYSYLRMAGTASNNGSYFVTDYTPNLGTTRITVKAKINDVTTGSEGLFVANYLTAGKSARANGSMSLEYFYNKSGRTPWMAYTWGTLSVSESGFNDTSSYHVWEVAGNTMRRDGIAFVITGDAPTGLADGPMTIGAMTFGAKAYYNHLKADVAWVKVEEKQPNGAYKVVHCWQPAKDANGKAAFWDIVTKTWLTPTVVGTAPTVEGAEPVDPRPLKQGIMMYLK